MLPEPTCRRRPAHGLVTTEPRLEALHELRPGVENLLTSTLTLLRQLRDADLLTGSIRHQAILVAVDGGSLELALDTVCPDATTSEAQAERQVRRRQLLRETIAGAGGVDGAVAALLRPDPQASIERGGVALSLVDLDPDLASDMADRLDARTGVSSLGVNGTPEAAGP